MLPRPLRVTSPAEHRELARRGNRAGTTTLVVHLARPAAEGHALNQRAGAATSSTPTARAGVVVGRPVGDAVTRHRVARRLRHLLAVRLAELQPGTTLVVRARPPAAAASFSMLATDLDAALGRLTRSGSRAGAVRSGSARSGSARSGSARSVVAP
jgi:ribonuclease P protein component